MRNLIKVGGGSFHLRLHSIGFKLFLAFLVSIVVGCAVSGWLVFNVSAQTLKEKVGNNAMQVTRDAAKQVDLWERQMEGIYNSAVLFAMNNQNLTEKRRNLLPATEADLAEYKKSTDRLAVVNEQIKSETAKLAPGAPKPIILNQLETEQKNLTARLLELNKAKTAADNGLRDYLSSVTMANGDMISFSALIRFNGDDQIFEGVIKTKPKAEPYKLPWVKQVVDAKGKLVKLPPQTGSYLMDNPQERVFAFAKAFWSPEDGVWADVVIMEFRLSYFEKMLSPITFGGIGEIHMLGEDGTTLFSNRSGLALGSPAAVGLETEQADRIGAFTDGSGRAYMTVGSKLENQSWTLIGAIPDDRLMDDAQKIQNRLFLMMAASVVAALLLGWWGYRTVGRPLLDAERTMQQAEQGDLSVRLGLRRRDEIGSVGNSFDRMMERINDIVVRTGDSASHLLLSTDRIRELVVTNESASKEIATAMEEVARGASDLAADAERSTTLTGKLHQNLQDVLDKNSVMQQVSAQMETESRNGLHSMQDLSEQSRTVEAQVKELQQKIDHLKTSTDSISFVLDLLKDISKKINILSLNASIVAAASGEAGKGFMVVAQEIRNLAAQSQSSINSVGDIIERVQADMQKTNELVVQSMPIFKRQLSAAESSQDTFQSLSESMQEFSNRFREVWDSVQASIAAGNELNAVLMQVSAVSEEFTASTEEVAGLVVQQNTSSQKMVETGTQLEELSLTLRRSLEGFKKGSESNED